MESPNMKSSDELYSIGVTDGQKQNLAKAYNKKSPITLRLKHTQLKGNFPLLLTRRQINKINKSLGNGTGVDIDISKSQISAQAKNDGFLGALAALLARTVLPMAAKILPKVAAPLATGALSGLASTGIGKLFGNGMVSVPFSRRQEVIRNVGPFLTKGQLDKIMRDQSFKLTKKQRMDGGFLPLLLDALGSLVAPVLGSLFGKGLQVDKGRGLQIDSQMRPYRRIPRVKKKKKIF